MLLYYFLAAERRKKGRGEEKREGHVGNSARAASIPVVYNPIGGLESNPLYLI
jgi:hypothetical protein